MRDARGQGVDVIGQCLDRLREESEEALHALLPVREHAGISGQGRQVFLPGQFVFKGQRCREHDGGCFASGTGNAEDAARQNTWGGKGQHRPPDGLPACGSESHAGLAEALWHGLQALFTGRDDHWQDDEGECETTAEHAGVPALEAQFREEQRDDQQAALMRSVREHGSRQDEGTETE